MSTTITVNATAFEDLAHIEAPREKLQLEASKPSLVGSYVVTGIDSDGKRYPHYRRLAVPGSNKLAISVASVGRSRAQRSRPSAEPPRDQRSA
jgi:hypothetical protein